MFAQFRIPFRYCLLLALFIAGSMHSPSGLSVERSAMLPSRASSSCGFVRLLSISKFAYQFYFSNHGPTYSQRKPRFNVSRSAAFQSS
jgi:hypothetical protein